MLKVGEWMKSGGVMVAGLAMATACATQDEVDAEERAPIAELTTADGHHVEFYEPKPGTIMIAQGFTRGEVDPGAAARSAVGLWERLAPGQDIPVALVEAQARVEIARASKGPRPEPKETIANANNSTFYNTYCVGSWDVIHCVLDRTSNYAIQYNSTDASRCTVSVDTGAVRFRLLVEDAIELSRDLFATDGITFIYDSGVWNDKVRCDVVNVGTGDRFDAAFRFNIN